MTADAPRCEVVRLRSRCSPRRHQARSTDRGALAPRAQVNDTVMFDIETGKIKDFIKFDVGQLVMVTGGRNQGRVGTITSKEKHKGSFDVCHVKDATGHDFATRCGAGGPVSEL